MARAGPAVAEVAAGSGRKGPVCPRAVLASRLSPPKELGSGHRALGLRKKRQKEKEEHVSLHREVLLEENVRCKNQGAKQLRTWSKQSLGFLFSKGNHEMTEQRCLS